MAMNTDKHETSADDELESVPWLARYFLWVDSESGVDRLIRILSYVCIVLFLIDIVYHRHTKVPGEGLWGFHAIAGFVAFSMIVIGARFLRIFIRRDEKFYAPYGVDAEEYPQADTHRLNHAERQEDSLADLGNQMLGRQAAGGSSNRGSDAGQGGAAS